MKTFWLLIWLLFLTTVCVGQTRFDIASQSQISIPNDGTTGTTINQLAKVNTSGNAINAGTSDTNVPVFIVEGGAGTTGNAQLAVAGPITCKFDASGGTAGDYVIASSSTAGRCHDSGAAVSSSVWTIGFLLTSPAANANGTVMLVQGFTLSAGGGFTGGTLTSELILAAATTGAASLNIPSGTAPTTPAAGDIWRDTNGFNIVESTSTNGSADMRGDQAGSVGPANTVRYTADSNVAKVSENGGALQEVVQLTKTQSLQNKSFDSTNTGIWEFLGTSSCTTSTCTVTPTVARKHYYVRFIIAGYSGSGGVARAEFGNTTTVDTGSNYAFAGFNIASGTSTAPTVSGVGSGSTPQEGIPVSGSPSTLGRFVELHISNAGARIKYLTIETAGVGASASVTPNVAHIAGTWNNTTNGIGVIQFKACTATTGTCSTVNFTTGTTMTVWGRDDN